MMHIYFSMCASLAWNPWPWCCYNLALPVKPEGHLYWHITWYLFIERWFFVLFVDDSTSRGLIKRKTLGISFPKSYKPVFFNQVLPESFTGLQIVTTKCIKHGSQLGVACKLLTIHAVRFDEAGVDPPPSHMRSTHSTVQFGGMVGGIGEWLWCEASTVAYITPCQIKVKTEWVYFDISFAM